MLDLETLTKEVESGAIDTVLVAFTDPYGRLLGKRLDAEFFAQQVATTGTHVCDYLLTADMEMEPVQGYGFASWQTGYGDVALRPDLTTLRRATWLERSAMVLCDVLHDEADPAPLDLAPKVGVAAAGGARLRPRLPRAGRVRTGVLRLRGQLPPGG